MKMERLLTVTVLSILLLFIVTRAQKMDPEQLQRLTSYTRCKYDVDCKENSFCFGNDLGSTGNCKCVEGYFLNRNRSFYECLLPAAYREPCGKDLQCHVRLGTLSNCSETLGLCECSENSHYAYGSCYHTAKLTEFCGVDFNCRLGDDKFAFCTDGQCECPLRHHPAQDLLKCVPSVKLGEPCQFDDSCNHTYASCYGVCRCIPGFTISNDGEKCFKAASQFGESCQEDVQCSEYLLGSICSKDICTCSLGYHGYGVACYKDASLGQMCTDKRECVLAQALDNSVDCVGGTCTCLTGPADNEYGCALRDSSATSGIKNSVELLVGTVFCLLLYLNLR